MKTMRLWFSVFCVLFVVGSASYAHAERNRDDKVGLGAAVGASWPIGTTNIKDGLKGVSFDWGFFVDIPIIKYFRISPAASLYKLKVRDEWHSVTDIDLSFKFIIPIRRLSLHAGVTLGLTAGADEDADTLTAHMGALGGVAFNVVANLDVFAMLQYKMLFHDLEKVNDLHSYLGLMIRL